MGRLLDRLSEKLLQGNMPDFSGNIYCIGRNYKDHATELGNQVPTEPIIFLKAPAALRAYDEPGIAFPDETFHHEVELVLLIGHHFPHLKNWPKVCAVALGIDVTRREAQAELKAKGLPWTKAKSFKGAAILTPFISITDFPHPDRIEFSLCVNGSLKQAGTHSDMVFSVTQLVKELSVYQDLQDGDLIFTGTPKGVGPIRSGDLIKLSFPQISVSFDGVF